MRDPHSSVQLPSSFSEEWQLSNFLHIVESFHALPSSATAGECRFESSTTFSSSHGAVVWISTAVRSEGTKRVGNGRHVEVVQA